jgi:glycosyltransferase involved in cell wall biosynthesis
MQKKAIITLLGNPVFDTRISNLASSLMSRNIIVSVIGFEWLPERVKEKNSFKIFPLKRKSAIKFYINFLMKLFVELKNISADYYFAEDVYTLPLVTLFAKFRKKKLFYNSRELYPFLAGLSNRKIIQFLLAKVERVFIKSPDIVMTTGEMDAEFLNKFYKLNNVLVLRNLPRFSVIQEKVNLREILNIPGESKIILYQGVIFKGRGIKIIIDVLKFIDNLHFVVLGDGIEKDNFIDYANKSGVGNRTHFLNSVNQEELIKYTSAADVGAALIENLSTSYYYALPSKLFEYIMAEIPVLCSDLPQMKKIVKEFNVGKAIPIESTDIIVNTLKEIINNQKMLEVYKENCKIARKTLNWEKEFDKFFQYL